MGSLNVQGLNADKARGLQRAWHDLYDVVLLQECKLSFTTAVAVEHNLRDWCLYWAHNTQAPSHTQPSQHPPASAPTPNPAPAPAPGQSETSPGRSAGVGIAIRRSLLHPPAHATAAATLSDIQRSPNGRLISLRLSWSGHSLRLASLYFPNQPADQRSFLAATLPALARLPGLPLWGGDFNFVEDAELDRRTARANDSSERVTATAWRGCLAGLPQPLVDAYRRLHPTTMAYTHFHHAGASRIDRHYIAASLVPSLALATIGAIRPGPLISDHRPIGIHLLPTAPLPAPAAPPPGRRPATTPHQAALCRRPSLGAAIPRQAGSSGRRRAGRPSRPTGLVARLQASRRQMGSLPQPPAGDSPTATQL